MDNRDGGNVMQSKYSWRSILWIVPIMLIVALYLYFRPESNPDQYIVLAKEVVVPQSDKTFEQSLKQCDNGDWSFFETNRGQKVVEFSGECKLDAQKPVNIQFLIDDDNNASLGAFLVNHEKVTEEAKATYFQQIAAQ